ncbi:MAG TPA: hypothetical protein VN612_15225 [Acidobacteriaceae bacterium]|nr:hypothetical protein [Acidobacteriaceae bacterium]
MQKKIWFVVGMVLVLVTGTSYAQSGCSPIDVRTEAILPLGIQNKLLAHRVKADDLELEAPADVGGDVVVLRKTLDVATQAFFRCEAKIDAAPTALQSALAEFLHTDRSKRADDSAEVYGSNLTVHVEDAKGFLDSVFVVLTFGIECGDDNLLLLFTKDGDHWKERLHWYADKYTAPSDAFGDFFPYAGVPGPEGKPAVAVAHGTPWCTSRMSGFKVDLIKPSDSDSPQKLLASTHSGYSRGDTTPTLKPYPEGVTLRLDDSSADLEGVFTYVGVFRYRTTTGGLVRLPVAGNVRDFVDSWLAESWAIAASWSADPGQNLKSAHERFSYDDANKDVPTIHYGAIRRCTSGTSHFQTEIDLTDIRPVSGKPQESKLPAIYAQVRQNSDSFTMLSISEKADASCTGPDLMKKVPDAQR